MYEQDELLPISALQHLLFCERRAALIYIENLWSENQFTAEGHNLHERAHEMQTENRGDLRIARGLWLRSLRLGIIGRADVVEFHRRGEMEERAGFTLPGVTGTWFPVPVEYKRGRMRTEEGYEIQLCAQALCLEEMLGVEVKEGALFYGQTRRRLELAMDTEIRRRTEDAILRLHVLIAGGLTSRIRRKTKCHLCSLYDVCLPGLLQPAKSTKDYLKQALACTEDIM